MKVLVTGATGFIGGRLVKQLLESGYQVRALVRDPARATGLERAGVELVRGDVTDAVSVEKAIDGVEGVLHLAAIYDFGVDVDRMRAVNVGGTRNVIDAATQKKVPRILYCGSDTSLGDTGGKTADEAHLPANTNVRSNYEQTKREAHQLVEERMAAGAPVVNAIVSTVYGPGDDSVIGELMENHLAGRLGFALDKSAGYTFAHVDDVADGLKRCFEKGALGERYMVSGEPARFGEFFETLSKHTGIPAPAVEVPRAMVPLIMVLMRALFGKSAAAARELVEMGRGVTRFFSGDKLRTQLGWQPRPLSDGLRETLPWFAAREREHAARALGKMRIVLVGLALFDIGLGVQAAFLSDSYIALIHPRFFELHPAGPTYWLIRTGFLWLVFAFIEAVAAMAPARRATWVLAVGVLRLMDVPADLAYYFSADDLGRFGRFMLIFSPIFNFTVGLLLLSTARRAIRAGLASMRV